MATICDIRHGCEDVNTLDETHFNCYVLQCYVFFILKATIHIYEITNHSLIFCREFYIYNIDCQVKG